MKLELTRTDFTEGSTIGELRVNGTFFCYTLEDVYRPGGVKVFGETAIPTGEYTVTLTYSPKFKRTLPLLVNVAGFIGVRIHPGNSAKDTEGCILVGRRKSIDWISESRAAFEELFAQMTALPPREQITLTVR